MSFFKKAPAGFQYYGWAFGCFPVWIKICSSVEYRVVGSNVFSNWTLRRLAPGLLWLRSQLGLVDVPVVIVRATRMNEYE